MKIPRPRLNLVELGMWAALVAVLAYSVGRYPTENRLRPYLSQGAAELKVLEEHYGPSHNSRSGEEWILRDFFRDERNGVFVEVGANHYQRDSNTFYLEARLGWSGLAIEPQTKFAADYRVYRPQTTFVPLFVSDTSNARATLYVPGSDLMASADKSVAEQGGETAVPVVANTTTLDDILNSQRLARIDFLSIDVELHEPEVLKGFSIERFAPRLVGIEAHAPVRQQILDYFAAHQYVVVGRYLRADSENLWFMPVGPMTAGNRKGR
jgi:FkbM family methyltransferase